MKQCSNPDCQKKYYLTRTSDSVPGKEYEEIFCPHCKCVVQTLTTDSYFMAIKAEDLYAAKMGVPCDHNIIETDTHYQKSNDLQTDTYWYDEVDSDGKIVAKYILKNTTSISAPSKNNITFEKVG